MSIKILLLDVDGTMTDGKISYTNSGEESKSFCVKDGLAIVSWIRLGGLVAIITGRESAIVANRAKELGVQFCYQAIKNKKAKVEEILKVNNLTWDNVAAIGDDLNDLSMLRVAKESYCPNNASRFVKSEVINILDANGGNGAVREMIEIILKKENRIEELLNLWEVD